MAVADKLNELRIKANLIADDTTGLMEISVEVHDGVAVLRGEVENERQKAQAEELAYEVDGIEEVTNELQIVRHDAEEDQARTHLGYTMAEGDVGDTAFAIAGESAGPGPGLATSEQFLGEFGDAEIEREVRDKLAEQNMVDVSKVKISSSNQIVHLKGCVNTPEDLYNLHDMVLNVRGVMGINSDVEVKEGEVGTQQ
jgi:osmotically-inducible protein OsmY